MSSEEIESEELTLTISKEDCLSHKRLDTFLAENCKDLSRNFIKNLFKENLISFHEDSPITGKLELKKLPGPGAIVVIEIPPPAPADAIAEDIPLTIIFEDEHLIIVDKPAGMVVHPAPGHQSGTLVNAILHHCQDLTGVGDQKRPGIVHRLDKGTSGLMVVAKNQKTHEGLVSLFSKHDIIREYRALVMKTRLDGAGEVDAPIGRHPKDRLKMSTLSRNGKRAKTYYRAIEFFESCTLVSCTLETGRTHQIRVHMGEVLRAPLLMDPLYGAPSDHIKRLPNVLGAFLKNYPHPLLHATKLGFVHPITKKELLFERELPEVFQKTLELLRQEVN